MPWNVKHFGLCVPTPLYHLYPRGNFPSFHPETIIQKKKKNLWAKCLVKKKKLHVYISLYYYSIHTVFNHLSWGFPGGTSGKEPACQCKRHKEWGFISSWIEKISWGHGNPLQYSCLENPHGQRSLEGYSPLGHKESDITEVTYYIK